MSLIAAPATATLAPTRSRPATRSARPQTTSAVASRSLCAPPAAVDPDRFRGDEDQWPGGWAAFPRPWQKPERRLLSLETRQYLARALQTLPERQRIIVALRDVEGMSADEVCQRLSLSQENQRVLLHRGRSRLRAALEEYLDVA